MTDFPIAGIIDRWCGSRPPFVGSISAGSLALEELVAQTIAAARPIIERECFEKAARTIVNPYDPHNAGRVAAIRALIPEGVRE